MAKTRKGSRKTASRAKSSKSTGKPKKKPALNLKQLRKDIEKAKAVLAKRQTKHQQAANQKAIDQLATVESVFDRWSNDIAMLCADPNGEPCGPNMVIS